MDDALLDRLSALGSNRERAETLHAALREAGEERVGALLLGNDDSPLALVSGRTEALALNGGYPAALLLWALWTDGTERLITWHSKPVDFQDPLEEDLDFATHLVDLGALLGLPVLDHWIFGADERRLALRSWMGWDWPTPSRERLKAESKEDLPPTYWNPVSGEKWSGRGRFHPPWVSRLDSLGLSYDAVESPYDHEDFQSFGVPGVNLFSRVGVIANDLAYRPPPGWDTIVLEPDELLGLEVRGLVRGLLAHLHPRGRERYWGAVFLDEVGRVRRPTAGVWAPRPLVAGRPSSFFTGSLKLGYRSVLTFSSVGLGSEPPERDFALAERIRTIGEVVGFPVEDHYFIESADRHFSWKNTTRWAWTEIGGLGRGAWPPR